MTMTEPWKILVTTRTSGGCHTLVIGFDSREEAIEAHDLINGQEEQLSQSAMEFQRSTLLFNLTEDD